MKIPRIVDSEDLPLAQQVFPDQVFKVLSSDEWNKEITSEDAILIAGPPAYCSEDSVLRLCMECGQQVSVREKNKEATKIVCVECARKSGIL